MEIHISDQTHKFQNETGLDAKANSELKNSKQVNSVCKMEMEFITESVHFIQADNHFGFHELFILWAKPPVSTLCYM